MASTAQSNVECGKGVKKRLQAGWSGWTRVSGVICDKRVAVEVKGKTCKTTAIPALLCGLETVALRSRAGGVKDG